MLSRLFAVMAALFAAVLAAPVAHAESVSVVGPIRSVVSSAALTLNYTCDATDHGKLIVVEIEDLTSNATSVGYSPAACQGYIATATVMTGVLYGNPGDSVRYKIKMPGGTVSTGEGTLGS
ncbi:hypothetical protein [Nocardia sp. NPDC050406]|uniref:hypothetical protein n=1 Tax=Nocardia sp. NPDC050406 TaxID=3364318 RepID=UPI0037B149FF